MNQQNSGERIAIIGAGRLAQSLWRTFASNVALVLARHPVPVEGFPPVDALGSVHTRLAPAGVTTIWIATSDAAIAEIVEILAATRFDFSGVAVVHSSGATPASILAPLAARGALTVALHPNGAFTGAEPVPAGLLWGLSSPDPERAVARMEHLLAPLAPRIVTVADDSRALYHAAASVAANGSVALFALAERLYHAAGFDVGVARTTVAAYMRQAAERCQKEGPERSLTGPIVRGDRGVVEQQRRAVAATAHDELHNFERLIAMVESLAQQVGGGYQSGASSSSSAA